MAPPRRRPLDRRKRMMVVTAWVLIVALIVGVLASLLFLRLH